MELTNETLRNWVRVRLGITHTVVELQDPQLDVAIDDTLELFNQYLCKCVPTVLESQSGSIQIQLDQDTQRGVVGCQILFPEQSRVYAQWNIFEIMYRMIFPRLPLGEWYELKSFYEQYQRVRGTDPDWNYDESSGILYVDCYSGPYDVFYWVVTDLQVPDFGVTHRKYIRQFRKGIMGYAKMILSEIRGKFTNTIPVPGGALTTNADQLRAEGEAATKEVEAWCDKQAQYATSPVIIG